MGYPSAATSLNSEKLEKLLLHAKVTQQSIQTVSTWILDRRAFLHEVVDLWVKLLREGDAAHQIVYLYIANDTMQVGVRKYGKHISEVFETRLLEVVEFVMTQCDEKVKRCMIKIIGIWKERHTITPPLLESLENVCAGKPAVAEKPVADELSVDDQVRATKEALLKEIASTACEEAVLADMTDVLESEATSATNRRLQDVVSATISADLLSDRMFQLESSLSTFHHAVEAYSPEGNSSHAESKTEDGDEEEKTGGEIVWEMLDQPVFDVDTERSREHVHQYRTNLEAQNAKRDELVNHLESLKLLDPFEEPIFHTSSLLRVQQLESLERMYTVCLQAELLEKQRGLERSQSSRPPLAPTSTSFDAMRVSTPTLQSSYSPSSHNDYYRSSESMVDSFQQVPPRGLGHRRYSSMDSRDPVHHHGEDPHRYDRDADIGYNKRPRLQHSQSLDDSRRERPSRWDQSPRWSERNSMSSFQEHHHGGGFGYGDRTRGGDDHRAYNDRSPRYNDQHSSRRSRWDDQPRRW